MVMQPIDEDAKQGGTEWAALPEPNGWTLAVATLTIDPGCARERERDYNALASQQV